MSSSQTEAQALVAAMPGEAAAAVLELRQQRPIKRLLPQTMFGRSLLLIVMPLVMVQIIATWVFYARHWETVSYRLALDVAGDIGLAIEAMKPAESEAQLSRVLETAANITNIDLVLQRGRTLPPEQPSSGTLIEEQLRQTLSQLVARPYRIDAVGG